ncbi:hypothetical protein LTS12_026781 [Elasticomyces elasticus]|nr:hypothetical protein LTS12_026781 [Elasticomyces elasticus]
MLGVVALPTVELDTPVPVGNGVVAFAEFVNPVETAELEEPVPVGNGVVAFAETVKPLETLDAVVVAFPVTGWLWVWMTVVPFSVQSDVKVVYDVWLTLGVVALTTTELDTPVPVGNGVVALAEIVNPLEAVELDTPVPVVTGVVAFAEIVKPELALVVVVAFAVMGWLWVWITVVPFSVQSDVNVVKEVWLTLGVVALTTTDELETPVPVGPAVGVVAFAEIVKPELALAVVVAFAVIGWLWSEVKVVKLVWLTLGVVAFTTTEDEIVDPVPIGPTVEEVAFAETEKPLLTDEELEDPVPIGPTVTEVAFAETGIPLLTLVTGWLWVWMTVVPFSVHKLVKVVKLVWLNDDPVPVADGVVAFTVTEKPLLALADSLVVTIVDEVAFPVMGWLLVNVVKLVGLETVIDPVPVGPSVGVVALTATVELRLDVVVAFADALVLSVMGIECLVAFALIETLLDVDEVKSLVLDDTKLEEESVLVAFALLVKPLKADELASLELDNAELDEDVVLATAEEGVMYGDDELPGIVVTGAEFSPIDPFHRYPVPTYANVV